MTWNYRVILHDEASDDDAWYGLHEVYYDDAGKPEKWTEEAVRFVCDKHEGPAGIYKSLAMALNDALRRPMLIERAGELVAAEDQPA